MPGFYAFKCIGLINFKDEIGVLLNVSAAGWHERQMIVNQPAVPVAAILPLPDLCMRFVCRRLLSEFIGVVVFQANRAKGKSCLDVVEAEPICIVFNRRGS